MAGNPIAEIRRWWDRLSTQWEFLSQLGILIVLGQHLDTCIESGPRYDMCEKLWKNKLILKVFLNCDFYSGMVLFTCRFLYYTPRTTKLLGGYTGFTPSVRPSVRPSVCPSVRPSRMPCPLCIIYSYGWILFILGTNDHYHERVCRAPWPLTLTYIFKVVRPWLRKSCPLCSVYSSGWILSIFGTNDHYH